MSEQKIKNIFWVIGALGVGILIGLVIPGSGAQIASLGGEELRLGSTTFTNPLLECEVGSSTIASRKEDFTAELVAYVDSLKQGTEVSDIAVYFRDLNNGPVIGVNQNEPYAPASLLKVPLMIAYLQWAESNPEILSRKIVYEELLDTTYQQQFAPETPLVLGTTYTVRDLIEQMVKYSDNQALMLLFREIPPEYQKELFTLVGVDPELITDPNATLTVKQYSIFFRILFNSSFLSRTNSEYALGLLSQTSFMGGIRKAVPENVLVAHKFGERRAGEGLQQFHDCGIVYYPNHPYMICIMTRGKQSDVLVETIESVAAFVYQKIDDQYGK